jgi:hypothetical protein
MMNSARSGDSFRRSAPKALNGRGDARRDTGSVMRSRRTGARTKTEEGEICTRKDKASKDAGARPVGRSRVKKGD